MNVELKKIEDQYVVVDPNPNNIRFGDIACEKTINGYRLVEIDSNIKKFDKTIYRKVIAFEDRLGVRLHSGEVVKLDLNILNRLHKISSKLFLEVYDEYEFPEMYAHLPLWDSSIPKLDNDLFVLSYLYIDKHDVPVEDTEEWNWITSPTFYEYEKETIYKSELEIWENHKASSWLGKWYRQIKIDKLKKKLEKIENENK
jgi:hypothetical protein